MTQCTAEPRATLNWRDRCGRKLTTAKRAIGLIRPGEHIFISSGSAVPLGLVPTLVDDDVHLGDNEIIHLLTLGDAPYTRPEFAAKFRHNALFIGPNVRAAVSDGRADYTPVFLSELPGLIRSRHIRVDAAVISVTPPDENGFCRLGTHIDVCPAALDAARVIVAQVNPSLPWTYGPERVHVDRIDAMVEIDLPIPELRPRDAGPETAAIAGYIAELIPDGATLQLGIGSIPDAVLGFLRNHNDLGIHTEMFSDGVVDLARRGVITGKRKTINTGKITASFVMGTRATYDFMDRNPNLEMYASDYTNDPFVIAQNDDMIAINTALQIDLTGQVCSDSIGTTFYSGIGGQVDFIRGAARAKRGKPIIALPSTAKEGTVSRIVPRLDAGAGVVTTRGDVHWVVTEYGAVSLHGRNVRERAMALISIAHPRFRPWLLAEAKQSRLVYVDQLEPPIRTPLYPRQFETRVQAKDGAELLIRPIKPTDERPMHDMFYHFSQETIYQRFFQLKQSMPHTTLQSFCTIDYDTDMTLVACLKEDDVERIVGMAMYALDARTQFGEAAFVVEDPYQGRGIGTALMRRLTEIAESRAVKGFTATVLAGNARMMRVFEKCGYAVQAERFGDTVSLRMGFKKDGG